MKPAQSSAPPTGSDRRRGEACGLLHDAYLAALQSRRNAWDFAIDLSELYAAGVTGTDLRSLLCEGLVAHALEELTFTGPGRSFRRLATLTLPSGCCFVLTESGFAFAQAEARRAHTPPGSAGPGAAPPHWDAELRELWWEGRLVKRFRTRAASQETILLALEEDGWPRRIDDPLPQAAGVDPFQRLHDAVRGLNRNQCHPLLFFQRDGTGCGVQWQARVPTTVP